MSLALVSKAPQPRHTLLVQFEPLLTGYLMVDEGTTRIAYLPTGNGPARMLRDAIRAREETLGSGPSIDRVVLGDLGVVISAAEGEAWIDAVRAFAATCSTIGESVPVVVYDGRPPDRGELQDRAAAIASTHAHFRKLDDQIIVGVSSRTNRTVEYAIASPS